MPNVDRVAYHALKIPLIVPAVTVDIIYWIIIVSDNVLMDILLLYSTHILENVNHVEQIYKDASYVQILQTVRYVRCNTAYIYQQENAIKYPHAHSITSIPIFLIAAWLALLIASNA